MVAHKITDPAGEAYWKTTKEKLVNLQLIITIKVKLGQKTIEQEIKN